MHFVPEFKNGWNLSIHSISLSPFMKYKLMLSRRGTVPSKLGFLLPSKIRTYGFYNNVVDGKNIQR